MRTILYRIAHITHRTSGTADVQWRSWVKMTAGRPILEYQFEQLEAVKAYPDYVENQRNA